jgi:TetR/AcrR family transcriptional regulator, cholesterol catabolism regulator
MAKIKVQANGTKKDIIVKNAAALFRKKGFSATSVRELAESLGIEAPSLYNHIGSKVELLQEICFAIADDYTGNMEIIIHANITEAQKVEAIIRFHVRKLSTDFDRVFVADHEWKQLPKKKLEEFLMFRRNYEKHIVDIVTEGMDKKVFKNLLPNITVLTILSAVRGLELTQKHKSEFTIEQLEDNMVQHLLNGIIK